MSVVDNDDKKNTEAYKVAYEENREVMEVSYSINSLAVFESMYFQYFKLLFSFYVRFLASCIEE